MKPMMSIYDVFTLYKMGQCATVNVSRGAAIAPGNTGVSLQNEGAEEEEEEEEDPVCKGCICEGCKCCKSLLACFAKIGICLA